MLRNSQLQLEQHDLYPCSIAPITAECSCVTKTRNNRCEIIRTDWQWLNEEAQRWRRALRWKVAAGTMRAFALRKRGRAVECTGLENRRPFTGLVSSNLTASATYLILRGLQSFFYIAPHPSHQISSVCSWLAAPQKNFIFAISSSLIPAASHCASSLARSPSATLMSAKY